MAKILSELASTMFPPRNLLPLVLLAAAFSPVGAQSILLHAVRSSPGDLEIAGEVKGVPAGATRYIRYQDLLRLPQESYRVTDDTNFRGPVEISGISLATVVRQLGRRGVGDLMAVAICYDSYRTNYPRSYMQAHHPLLVLRINGKAREGWPLSEYGGPLGPYLISHPFFRPAFRVLSHDDEPQIPFGVTRIELRRESVVFGAISPRGQWAKNSPVAQGYAIAQQDCFRCHNAGTQGGTMSGEPWSKLADDAQKNPDRFQRIIHDPAAVTSGAKMPPHSDYDGPTLHALTAYFRSFADAEKRHGRSAAAER